MNIKQVNNNIITATRERVADGGEERSTLRGPLRGASPSRALFDFDRDLSEHEGDETDRLLMRVTMGRFYPVIGLMNCDDRFLEIVWRTYHLWKQRRLPLCVRVAERFMSAVCDQCDREQVEYPRSWMKVLRDLREEMAGE